MHSYIVEEADGPFVRVEGPKPMVRPGDVLVRVRASGVNPLDTKIRVGTAAHARHPLPAVVGLDMAGTVEEVGSGVDGFRPGDEVYGMVGGVGGLQGTLAEWVSVPAPLLATKPKSLSMRAAAALPLVTITAWEGLVDRAGVQAGQTVLVHAGAGGVGATVSASKRAIVDRFGGAIPIDYTEFRPEEYVAFHTSGEGFDIIYDTVGGNTIDASFTAVKRWTGHVVSCLGWTTHSLAPLSFRGATYSGVFTLLPLLTGVGQARHRQILTEAAKIVDAGQLAPLLSDHRYSLSEIEAAHAAVASGSLGKVVVEL